MKYYRSVKNYYKNVVNQIKEVQPSTPWGIGVQDRGRKGVARKPEPAKRAADPGLSMDCGAIRAGLSYPNPYPNRVDKRQSERLAPIENARKIWGVES